MSKPAGRKSFLETLATFIVDKRNLIFFVYLAAAVFSLFSTFWVDVNSDLISYLPKNTETRQGIEIMGEEFVTYGTARVMVTHVTYELAEDLAEQISEIDGVSSVTFDRTEAHFKGSEALFDVSFSGQTYDQSSKDAMNEIKAMLEPYDTYISSEVGYSLEDTLNREIMVISVMAVVIIVAVLLLTSRSWAEIPLMLITFGAAALLNMGTNYWYQEISFVSNSVTVLLQLALAIDYAIILLHRFGEEREYTDDRTACIRALCYSIPAIAASSLTTMSGMVAMMFMQFRIGFDMGLCLVKAILFSMLSVFTLMPGLLMLFSKAIQKTQHKLLIPKIDFWGKFIVKLRHITAPLFLLVLIGGCLLSSACPYNFGYSNIRTSRQNEQQVANDRVNSTFGTQNIMALLVPKGDYASEKALLKQLESYDEVSYAMGLSNIEAMDGYTLVDELTPRQFAELTDMDYEVVQLLYAAYAASDEEYGRIVSGIDGYTIPLMDLFLFVVEQADSGMIELEGEIGEQLDGLHDQLVAGKQQMMGEHYSRMMIALDLPEESEETFAFLQTIHNEAKKYYPSDQIYLVGNSTSDYDLSVAFERDNIVISVLSIAFVILVLLFTFKSVGLPVLLILVIQGSIWINFSFPTLSQEPVFFMSYLIISAIQMGANIDYAIVISTRYQEMRQQFPPKESIIKALNLAFPTVFTSGTILASASFLLGFISTEPSIVGMGQCLCRGTLISIVLVMFVLPQLLVLGDKIVEKTRFNIKYPELTQTARGTVLVSGKVRGHINGMVDATMHGMIRGEVSAIVEVDTLKEQAEPDDPPEQAESQKEVQDNETDE